MDWAKTTARGYKKHLSFGIWCDLYQRFYGIIISGDHLHWSGRPWEIPEDDSVWYDWPCSWLLHVDGGCQCWSHRHDQGTSGARTGPQCARLCGRHQNWHVSRECSRGYSENVAADTEISRLSEDSSVSVQRGWCGRLGNQLHIRKVRVLTLCKLKRLVKSSLDGCANTNFCWSVMCEILWN